MNDWLVNLTAGIDNKTSRKQINKNITQLQKQVKKLKINAKFDGDTKKNLLSQINSLKVSLKDVTIPQETINKLVTQINDGLSKINVAGLDLGNLKLNGNNVVKQANDIGQQIENTFSKGKKGKSGLLDNFRLSLSNMGMDSDKIDRVVEKIKKLNINIDSLNQSVSHSVGKRGAKDILSIDVSGVDNFGNAIQKTEIFDKATGKLIKSLDGVSTAQKKAGASTNSFAKQQSKAVTDLTNQINKLYRATNDKNASRPIVDEMHLKTLDNAYNDIISAIERMRKASSDTFIEEKNNVKTLITNFESLVSEFRNAENVSTKMKGTSFLSGFAIAINDLEKFKADAKEFPQMVATINTLDDSFTNIADSSSLNTFNDQLRVAKAELSKLKSELRATNRSEKLQIDISGFESKIVNLQRISPEISNFKTLIDGTEVSVESLLEDLSKVNTPSDLSVVKSKYTAFTNAAKSAGIATTEFSSIVKNQLKQVKDAFTQTFSIAAIGMAAISETQEAITKLKEVDTYLTEISKANETLTKSELMLL